MASVPRGCDPSCQSGWDCRRGLRTPNYSPWLNKVPAASPKPQPIGSAAEPGVLALFLSTLVSVRSLTTSLLPTKVHRGEKPDENPKTVPMALASPSLFYPLRSPAVRSVSSMPGNPRVDMKRSPKSSKCRCGVSTSFGFARLQPLGRTDFLVGLYLFAFDRIELVAQSPPG